MKNNSIMTTQLQTEISVKPLNRKISHTTNVMLLGSCFSENISNKLSENLFPISANPTGILYNPLSIIAAIKRINTGKEYTADELFFHNELWHSWDHHSAFSSPDCLKTLKQINEQFKNAVSQFKNLDFLILTPGTALAYKLKQNDSIVANCHKFPHNHFTRILLSPDEIVCAFNDCIEELLVYNKKLMIILSVSPIRYLSDSPHLNQVSKSHLITAIYKIEQRYPEHVYYFPSYEIMMDELRDYRYYTSDMIHPSDTAISIIWDKFRSALISENSNSFIDDYAPIASALNHRIQYPLLQSTKQFSEANLLKVTKLKTRFPEIDLTNTRNYFSSLL